MRIQSVDEYLQLKPDQLANTVICCPFCGKDHAIPFRKIRNQTGCLQELPAIMHGCLGFAPQHIGVVYDINIEPIIETSVLPHIKNEGNSLFLYPLGDAGHLLEPTDQAGNLAVKNIHPNVQILIGVGSGVICDLTKYIADKTNLPFIICGTALSMNAYTSITAVITENKFKLSKFLKIADAVILDPNILATAPVEMTLAGIGDLAARSICNADFRLSHLMNGTWFCPLPYLLTAAYEARYFACAAGIGQSQRSAIETFAGANLISGYSMTMVNGETFPSSGAEHVISHFMDLQHELFNAPMNLHGAQVGIATLVNHAMYQMILRTSPTQINIAQIIKTRPKLAQLQAQNLAIFGESGEYLNRVLQEKYLPDDDLEKKLTFLKNNWTRIWEDIQQYITPPDQVRQCYLDARVPTALKSIHRTRKDLIDAILFSSRYRTRYTILDLLWELNLLPEVASEILTLSGIETD